MRAISQAGLERAWARTQRVAWLLTLSAGEWQWRGATLALELGAEYYPARLVAAPHWSESLPRGEVPGGLARASAEVRVLDLPGGDDSLRDRLAVTPPVGMAATLAMAWLDGAAPLDPAEAAPLLRGRVTAWRLEPLGVTLTLADELQALAPRRVGRLLHAAMAPGSPSLGQALPWIFGRIQDAELLPLNAGAASRLAEAVDDAATVLRLDSLAGFATHGRVQLDQEVLEYSDVDPVRVTLGTADSPLSRSAPAAHPRGTPVRLIPAGGFTWLVADHPCHAVGPMRADGIVIDPAGWTAATLALDGIPAQIVTMAQWPAGPDQREAARLTAAVEGLADPGGALIENPARVIERLLTDPRLGALGAEDLDAGSFASAAAALAARGARYARRVAGAEFLGGLLETAAGEAALWLHPSPPLRLAAIEPTPQPGAVEQELGAEHFFERIGGGRDAFTTARISAPDGLIPPPAIELTGRAPAPGQGRPALRFPGEAEAPGVPARRFALDWIDLAASQAGGDLGEVIWAHLGDAPFELEEECPPGAALLTAGATVRITTPVLDLEDALAWVDTVSLSPPGPRVRLRLRGPWAGAYAWRADAFNFIRRYAFGSHLALGVGGAVAGRLSRSGALRLRGRLREEAMITAGPFADPAALSGGKLYLNWLNGGAYQPYLALDGEGNADLAGRVREHSAQAMDPAGLMLGAAPGRGWLSPDGAGGVLEFSAAEGILHLKGVLIEGVRL